MSGSVISGLNRQVGQNLRRFRRDLGLSQEEFGELIGMHRTRVGLIERGDANLTLVSIERLAAQIGLAPILLLRPDGVPGSTRERTRRSHRRPSPAADSDGATCGEDTAEEPGGRRAQKR